MNIQAERMSTASRKQTKIVCSLFFNLCFNESCLVGANNELGQSQT